MATHFSDIGIHLSDEHPWDDFIEMLEENLSNRYEVQTKDGRLYGIICIDGTIEFWLPINEDGGLDPDLFELHYDTGRWSTVKSPKWISKENDGLQGLLNAWQTEDAFPFNAVVPNAACCPEFIEDEKYKCQIACFVEQIDVYTNEEEYRERDDSHFAVKSFFPIGQFTQYNGNDDDSENAKAIINGVIKNIIPKTNTYTKCDYFLLTVESLDMEFDLLVDEKELPESAAVGNIISATVWMSAKFENVE
ncbi:MAG: hypothetical protein IJO52_10275 [Clostridia bacterium]|nr:hypothetical protein [Clostridia bacterium]MBQ9922565.1 hypothetical protein [Clostridia bacterium]